MAKRRILLSYWVVALSLLPSISYAYLDPATTTYIIQIITALIITLGVTMSIMLYKVKIIWVQVKVLFYRIYGILFSRNKIIKQQGGTDKDSEGDGSNDENLVKGVPKSRQDYEGVVPLPDEDENDDCEPQGEKGFFASLFRDKRKFLQRLPMAAIVIFAISFSFVFFGVADILIANADLFPFNFKGILGEVILFSTIPFAIVIVLVSICKGKVFNVLVSGCLALLIGGYIQGTFLNLNLGELTGDPVPWEKYVLHGIINLIVWIAIFVAILLLCHFKEKLWSRACIFIPTVLVVMQLVAFVSILSPGGDVAVKPNVAANGTLSEETLTIDGISEISNSNNVFVFILDRLDQEFVDQIKESDPNFFDGMDGFVEFSNHMTRYATTFPSIANILTGKDYSFREPAIDFFNDAYATARYIPELRENGFTTKLYIDSPYGYSDIDQLKGLTDNIGEITYEVKQRQAFKKLFKLSLYRYSPHVFKKMFWDAADDFHKLIKVSQDSKQPYKIDDVVFYNRLIEDRLEVTTSEGNFAFYHLWGPHNPYSMTEDIKRVKKGDSDVVSQAKGSFNIVYEFMDQLKEQGVYDNSTIIITGDHAYAKGRRLEAPLLVGLFVKPAGSAGIPLTQNNAPVTSDSLMPTVLDAAGCELLDSEETYFDVPQNTQRDRVYFHRMIPEKTVEEFLVEGDPRILENWKWIRDIQEISNYGA